MAFPEYNNHTEHKKKVDLARSLRKRTVSLLLLMGLLLSLIYSVVFSLQAREQLNTQQQIYNENLLQSASDYIDNTLDNLSGMIGILSRNAAIFSQGIYDTKNYNDALLAVRNIVVQTEIVEEAFVHTNHDNYILSSDFVHCPAEESAFQKVISAYHASDYPKVSSLIQGKTLNIFFLNDELYLAQDYPFASDAPFGTVFFKVNTDVLYRGFSAFNTDRNNLLFIYGPDMEEIFARLSYSSADPTVLQLLREKAEEAALPAGYSCLYSTKTDWLFLTYSQPLISLTLTHMAEMLVVVLIVIAVFYIIARFLLKNIFAPLDSLVQSFEAESSDPFTDEIDMLNKAVSSVIQSQRLLESSMEKILPRATDEFYSKLLDGQAYDETYIRRTLPIIDPCFRYNGNIILCIYQEKTALKDASFPDIIHPALAGFADIIKHYYWYHRPNTGEHILILQFADEVVHTELAPYWKRISIALSRALGLAQIDMQWAYSQPFTAFIDLNVAYEEAVRHLEQRPHETLIPEDKVIASDMYADEYAFFYSRMKKAILQLLEQNPEAAHSLYQSALEFLLRKPGDEEILASFCTSIRNAYLDAMQPLSNFEFPFEGLTEKWRQVPFSMEVVTEELTKTEEALRQYILDKQEKLRHKTLVQAMQYIQAHYSDDTLSLSTVSEAVDASPNYLSRLFNNNLETSFVAYINKVRIDAACSLMKESNATTKHIAMEVGYISQQTFFRAFKSVTGLTPSEYRDSKK